MKIISGEIQVSFQEETLGFEIQRGTTVWKTSPDFGPVLVTAGGEIPFMSAEEISFKLYENGVGKGIAGSYQGFLGRDYRFETRVWIETETGIVRFEWIPLKEDGLSVTKVLWPGEFSFKEAREDWYTVITNRQGMLIPNTWKTKFSALPFEGRFGTAGGYMSWFGQIKERQGYLAICETPWNAGYQVDHPENGPYTHVSVWWEPSLGKMRDRRILQYRFLEDCDYNDLCKSFRRYRKELGYLVTLKEKEIRNPKVKQLIGCSFVHRGIKTQVQPDSEFYNKEEPWKNHSLTTFEKRAEEIRELRAMGVEQLYLHLDGWGQEGYDNVHPDVLPPCEEAGGYEGMRRLRETVKECGYLFGIHDQYRDYYKKAESFDPDYAVTRPDGSRMEHSRWGGGAQAYLCAAEAPYYVKRNYSRLIREQIVPDCAYLDVFTCNEADECANPMHRVTRKEAQSYRNRCFDYLTNQGILPSSEEVNDWSAESLVFCHYAPYAFMMHPPGTKREGIPVPLFNLVYHDCLIIPWMMEKNNSEDYMLYALLNGGAPYLIRDGAYPDFDGAFSPEVEVTLPEQMERCKIVSSLHRKVAESEMLFHRLMDPEGKIQQTVFANGTSVTIDLEKNIYRTEDLV